MFVTNDCHNCFLIRKLENSEQQIFPKVTPRKLRDMHISCIPLHRASFSPSFVYPPSFSFDFKHPPPTASEIRGISPILWVASCSKESHCIMALRRWMWQSISSSSRSSPLPINCRYPVPFTHLGAPTISHTRLQAVFQSNKYPTPLSVRWSSKHNANASIPPTNDDDVLNQILSNQKKQQEDQRARDVKDNLINAACLGVFCYWVYSQRKQGKTWTNSKGE